MLRYTVLFILISTMPVFAYATAPESRGKTSLLVVLDGLRPDYVTEARMPNLYRFGQSGVIFESHHSTYPTVTRVNASSLATGAYPERHGLMDNTVYFPEVDADHGLSTGSRATLERIAAATGGTLLSAPSLGEILESAGKRLLALSSGSSGSSFLLNHKVRGDGIINTDYILPESRQAGILEKIGPAPDEREPNDPRNTRIVDALLHFGLNDDPPAVILLWLSDPDHTGHEKGIGDPVTEECLRLVDGQFGRILSALDARGLRESTDIMVTSDHGFSTHTGAHALQDTVGGFMAAHGRAATDLVSAGAGVYLKAGAKALLPELVAALQHLPECGALFTRAERPGSIEGGVAGTFSLDLVHLRHERAPDLVISPGWDSETNEHGFAGRVMTRGGAGHGSASPWDIHNSLFAAGPGFKKGLRSAVPSHNVDLAPTLCYLQGIAVPASMQGRVLREAIAGGPDPGAVEVSVQTHVTSVISAKGSTYEATLQESIVEGKRYFDFAAATIAGPPLP